MEERVDGGGKTKENHRRRLRPSANSGWSKRRHFCLLSLLYSGGINTWARIHPAVIMRSPKSISCLELQRTLQRERASSQRTCSLELVGINFTEREPRKEHPRHELERCRGSTIPARQHHPRWSGG